MYQPTNMYILNTTFAVEDSALESWSRHLSQTIIPELQGLEFCNIKLYEILSGENDEMHSLALHCEHKSLDAITLWLKEGEKRMKQSLAQLFGERVLIFSTVMNQVF